MNPMPLSSNSQTAAFTFYFIPLIIFLWLNATISHAQCDGRYETAIFDSVIVTTVLYGGNYDSHGRWEDLYMDIYTPYGDVAVDRPLVILAHGGAFLDVTNRKSRDIRRLCNSFARLGYVCASFDYREETDPLALLSSENMIKAIIRAGHDGKAAIRYFKKSAEEGNPFYLDPDQIIVGGVSAGAILALNLVYLTDINMAPWPWNTWAEQLGGLNGNSGNPGYDTDIVGILNIAGALGKPYWINGNNVPMIHIHSNNDPIVPYGVGKPLGIPILPNLYGSFVIHERAIEAGIRSELINFQNEGHVPFLNIENWLFEDLGYFNEIIWEVSLSHLTEFMYSLLACNPDNQVITGSIQSLEVSDVSLFPNPTNGRIHLNLPVKLDGSDISIHSMDGSLVRRSHFQGDNWSSNLDLPPGIYTITVTPDQQQIERLTLRLMVSP